MNIVFLHHALFYIVQLKLLKSTSLDFLAKSTKIVNMGIEIELHPIQKEILLVLLFSPEVSFSKLNRNKVSTDQFNFHLKRLLISDLVEKADRSYVLTQKGKEFANRLDTESQVFEKQAKLSVLLCCIDKTNGVTKYLIQQRLKEPYFGFHGFVTGKVRLGGTILETAKRELKEETGYFGKLELVGIKHKMDYANDGKLLEDKFFFVIKATNLKGKLIEKFEGGKNIWFTKRDIFRLPRLFDGVKETMKLANQQKLEFVETKYTVNKF